jgi:hypothetical protein
MNSPCWLWRCAAVERYRYRAELALRGGGYHTGA